MLVTRLCFSTFGSRAHRTRFLIIIGWEVEKTLAELTYQPGAEAQSRPSRAAHCRMANIDGLGKDCDEIPWGFAVIVAVVGDFDTSRSSYGRWVVLHSFVYIYLFDGDVLHHKETNLTQHTSIRAW